MAGNRAASAKRRQNEIKDLSQETRDQRPGKHVKETMHQQRKREKTVPNKKHAREIFRNARENVRYMFSTQRELHHRNDS